MMRYSLQEAQVHLPQLITEALQGKTVVIVGENDEEVQLISMPHLLQPRPLGSPIPMAADFDEIFYAVTVR